MTERSSEVGGRLLLLLRQQRYLYHQLRILTNTQQELATEGSPELLLEVLAGRRKLLDKLRELDSKLRPVKANWPSLSPQIAPDEMAQVREVALHVRDMVREILAASSVQAEQSLQFADTCTFDELFCEPQSEKRSDHETVVAGN